MITSSMAAPEVAGLRPAYRTGPPSFHIHSGRNEIADFSTPIRKRLEDSCTFCRKFQLYQGRL